MKHLKIDFFKMIMLIVALISGVTAFAQTTIEGLVVDGTKEPIIGASVFVKGTSTGTATDFDGRFTLKVPSNNAILVISYVGCQSREIVANSPEVKAGIVLKEDAQNLEELVVIGYGSVKKQDATGSVMAIKPDELNKGNRVSAQDALVGKMAGVNVVSSTGAPGEGATIRIRSGASLSASNDPLIVIDGVPVDNSTIEGASNIIGSINPEDIETFTVLKDASATAIYGSRASNGVIIITTKKGSGNDRIKVNFQTTNSLQTRTKVADMLGADDMAAIVNQLGTDKQKALINTGYNTDWNDEIYKTAFGTDNNLSVAGRVTKDFPFRV